MKKIALLAMMAGAVALPFGTALAQETAGATQSEPQMEWQNPERIADIQDESERIRAYSVLIGESVYDEMLKADDVGSAEPRQIEAINIIDITEVLTPADVLGLELAAEANEDNIRRLQSYLELQADTKAKLEEEEVVPADVVGVQFSQGGILDILVVPGWLTK